MEFVMDFDKKELKTCKYINYERMGFLLDV